VASKGHRLVAFPALSEVPRSLFGKLPIFPCLDIPSQPSGEVARVPVTLENVVPVAERDRPSVVLHVAAKRGAALVVAQMVCFARARAPGYAARLFAEPRQIVRVGELAAVARMRPPIAHWLVGLEAGVSTEGRALHKPNSALSSAMRASRSAWLVT